MIETQVLVVGGGATGVGVARDAALRGLRVVLVERRRPGRGHDRALPRAAALRRPLRGQGSAFGAGVHRREPHPAPDRRRTASRTPAACSCARRPTTPSTATASAPGASTPASRSRRSTLAEALRREPRLNPGIQRAFAVPGRRARRVEARRRLRRGRPPPRRHRAHLPRRRRGDRRGRPRVRRARARHAHGRGDARCGRR